MANLLPSSPDPQSGEKADPRVIGLDSDDADDLLSAISSSTARRLLNALHDEPGTPSELAERADTSLQNAQYHLERLNDAGAIEVVDTCYSEKGREMNVFAPADRPLVVFAGGQEAETGLRAALARLFGGATVLLGVGAIVQAVLGQGFSFPADDAASTDADSMVALESEGTPAPDAAAESAPEATTELVSTLEALAPGLAFFLGGLAVLLVWFGTWYRRTR